jgi:hypothetical protein
MDRTRRNFLANVGKGMLIAGLGPAVASDLGLARVFADEGDNRLTFGDLEPLATLMEDTAADKLQALLIEKIQSGTALRTLVAAGALANARKFGGHHYVGFHTFMALSPAFEMSRELPEDRRALPVLKVLYRNASTIQQTGGRTGEVLKPVKPTELPEGAVGSQLLRSAMKKLDMARADSAFAALIRNKAEDAYNDLQFIVEDEVDVHRVVLAWRAWMTLDITGKQHAETLLRQSVHYCVEQERRHPNRESQIRTLLPKLLDEYRLIGRAAGTRKPDDAWLLKLADTIHRASPAVAADATAAALAEGFDPEAVGEAMSLAANALLLYDGGREQADGAKGKGSVHGDSVGVHASDSANAWRNIARVSNQRNAVASLIVGAYHTAGQAGQRKELYPLPEHLEKVTAKDADALLRELESAVKAKEQGLACAIVQRYGEQGHAPRGVFDVLLRFAISEDGALHAEKYYRTVCEEFAIARPAFKWRHLVSLARVTASECGQPAPGYAEACKLLKV